jgi:hypothetical protein
MIACSAIILDTRRIGSTSYSGRAFSIAANGKVGTSVLD